MPDRATVEQRLKSVAQGHVLAHYDELPASRRAELIAQIESLDLGSLPGLIDKYVKAKPAPSLPPSLAPARYYPKGSPDAEEFRAKGEQLLREGKIAAFVVAGGQGTRLGFDGPKGCFPAGAVSKRPLFGIFADNLAAARERWGKLVPWYIMTSPQNHEATLEFFESQRYFGLEPSSVMFFRQGVMPSFEMGTGRMLLASKHEIATNPDGHGGSITALHRSGAIADMKARGIEHISYFQVDNPLVKVVDPVFIGLHAAAPDSSSEMSSKMIPKAYPDEKLGVFCSVNGRTEIIEYSDMPASLQHERLGSGGLRFVAGSIAVHMIAVGLVERLNTDPSFGLPMHRAEKKVPHLDEKGALIEPSRPNAVKLERFVFDALPLCRASIVYETDREEEFAPIKNADGVDSPASSARLQTNRAARWLRTAGVTIPTDSRGDPDCTLEISPRAALEPRDLRPAKLPRSITPGASILIG